MSAAPYDSGCDDAQVDLQTVRQRGRSPSSTPPASISSTEAASVKASMTASGFDSSDQHVDVADRLAPPPDGAGELDLLDAGQLPSAHPRWRVRREGRRRESVARSATRRRRTPAFYVLDLLLPHTREVEDLPPAKRSLEPLSDLTSSSFQRSPIVLGPRPGTDRSSMSPLRDALALALEHATSSRSRGTPPCASAVPLPDARDVPHSPTLDELLDVGRAGPRGCATPCGRR